jgi:hypothetical protein
MQKIPAQKTQMKATEIQKVKKPLEKMYPEKNIGRGMICGVSA